MTILSFLGLILVGAAVVITAVFGAAWLIAREVNSGGHGKGCPCDACQGKRLKEREAEKAEEPLTNPPSRPFVADRKPLPSRSAWMSTLELQPGMKVHGKTGKTFRVDKVDPITYGYMVVLVADLAESVARIPVAADQAAKRIWLVRKPRGSVE